MILALLIFFTYLNLNKMMEKSVQRGRLEFEMAWWPLHLAAALTVAALFAWRLNVNHRWHPLALIGAWKRRRLKKQAHGMAPAAQVRVEVE
jgi:lipopolysaccharide export system permease protein